MPGLQESPQLMVLVDNKEVELLHRMGALCCWGMLFISMLKLLEGDAAVSMFDI